MIKTFRVPDRRVATNIHFHENVVPAPIAISIDEPIALPVDVDGDASRFENPYKILHANLTMTGSLDPLMSKKETAFQANDSLSTRTTLHERITTSADKVSQIPIPMQIKSIMKKPAESDTKTQLRISTSVGYDHTLSEPSDASSYVNVKNVSSSDVVHLSDSKPLDFKSKHSAESNRTERLANGNVGEPNIPNIERSVVVSNGTTVAAQRNVDTKDISALFTKIEIKNHSARSTSSESSSKRNISTGHKSSSSDEFWK